MDSFQMHILAADHTFYEGPCLSLTIPTSGGEQGILAHHSNMIAAVQPGILRYRLPGQEVQQAAVSQGMVKVQAQCSRYPVSVAVAAFSSTFERLCPDAATSIFLRLIS